MTTEDNIVVTNPDYLTIRIREGSLRIVVSENNHFLLLSDRLFLFLEDGVLLVDKANDAQRVLVNSAFLHYFQQLECENLGDYHNHQSEYIQNLSRKQCIYDIDTLQVNVLYNDQLDNQFFMDIDGKILKLVANVDEEEQDVNNASFDFQDNETLTNQVYEAHAPDGPVKNY